MQACCVTTHLKTDTTISNLFSQGLVGGRGALPAPGHALADLALVPGGSKFSLGFHRPLGPVAPWQVPGAQKPSARKASAEVRPAGISPSEVKQANIQGAGSGDVSSPPVGGGGMVFVEQAPAHRSLILPSPTCCAWHHPRCSGYHPKAATDVNTAHFCAQGSLT